MDHSIISSNGKLQTRDGRTFSTLEEAQAHSAAKRKQLEAKWKYEIDDSTWARQGLVAAEDSRSMAEKVADRDYCPKRQVVLNPLEKLLAETESRMPNGPDRTKMSRDESIAHTLRGMIDREANVNKADAAKAAHLKANAAKIETINQLIFEEQFNPNSDQRFRETLRKAKLAIETPDADPAEVDQLTAAVNQELLARQANQQGVIQEGREALDAAELVNTNQVFLTHPEPKQEQQTEHVSDPNSYLDPMAGFEPQTKVKVNRKQSTFGMGWELYQAMQREGFPEHQVSEVYDVLYEDDAVLAAVVDRYAE